MPGISSECQFGRVANKTSIDHGSVGRLPVWPDSGKLEKR